MSCFQDSLATLHRRYTDDCALSTGYLARRHAITQDFLLCLGKTPGLDNAQLEALISKNIANLAQTGTRSSAFASLHVRSLWAADDFIVRPDASDCVVRDENADCLHLTTPSRRPRKVETGSTRSSRVQRQHPPLPSTLTATAYSTRRGSQRAPATTRPSCQSKGCVLGCVG